MGAMAEYFVGPVMEKLINACFDYLKEKKELENLRDIHSTIQAVVSAYIQAQIEDPDLNEWLWQLRDAVDELDDVLDEFEFEKKKIQKGPPQKKSRMKNIFKPSKSDPSNLKRLGKAVHKLYEISAKVSTYHHHEMRETRSMPTNIENVESDLSSLKLSYKDLSKSLKTCLAFCFIFPQDHEFDKNDLVRMWIAMGLIQSSDLQRDNLEEAGRRDFISLVQKSFFREISTFEGRVYYKMNQLAQKCFIVADDTELSIFLKTFRHLSLKTREASSQNMEKFENLRSLFLSSEPAVPYDKKIISDILKASKNIRLLVISGWNLEMESLEMIDCLTHLRYLKVEIHGSFKLPSSISHLYHLQFIISDMLLNIEMDNIDWKELMPNESCQLILDKVVIKDPSATQLIMEPLRRISSFRNLRIEGNVELVSFSRQTEQWFLQHTSSLFRLEFQKLQSLQSLPSSLESFSSLNTLRVCNVPQLKQLPNNIPASLVTLELCNLESLACLPSSLSTFSSLTNLTLKNIPLLKSLSDLPSSLITLYLEDLESLQRLPSLSTFSSLTRLKLINIPRLISLPDLPTSLKEREFKELNCTIKVTGTRNRQTSPPP